MTDHMDISKTIEAKSDQLNAADIMQPVTVTITDVRKGDADQPVWISTAEYPGKYFKPAKTVRRVLVHCWGADAAQYIGRQMTLYNDPSVTWAGEAVGGIRVSHLSHITRSMTFPLPVSRGKRQKVTIEKIEVQQHPIQQPAQVPEQPVNWDEAIFDCHGNTDDLRALWTRAQAAGASQEVLNKIQAAAQGEQA